MAATFVRFTLLAFVLLASARSAQANTLSATIDLANLPSTITLCRDPAVATYQVDEQWLVGIDIDNNPASPSGTYAYDGAEVLLYANTLPQNAGCSPTNASAASSIVAGMQVWDATQQNYVDSGQTVNVAVDPVGSALIISADVSGALANLTSVSRFFEVDTGGYTPLGSGNNGPATAYDDSVGIPIPAGYGLILPANDVQGCSAPCSTSAPWYSLVDLVGFSVNTTSPLPSPPPPYKPPQYGANTLDVEFDLTSLPASINTCPSNRTGYGYDLIWIAGVDFSTSVGVYQTLITAHTPLTYGCGNTQSLTALNGTLFHLDPNNISNGYTYVADLPVKVDIANGKILVQADRTNQYLAGVSSSTVAQFVTIGEVAASAPNGDFPSVSYANGLFSTFPSDNGPQFNFGSSFTTPANNVCTSSTSCISSAYPQIDLIGGSVHMDDYIFRNGFE